MDKKLTTLMLVLICSSLVFGAEPRTIFIEAETMEGIGLPDGWYTVWNKHRSGGAEANIREESVKKGANIILRKKLEEPLPAGKYNLFVGVFRMLRGNGGELEVGIGEAKAVIKWEAMKRDRWEKASIEILSPAKEIVVKAIRAEGSGVGDATDPEDTVNKIVLDCLCITDDSRISIFDKGGNRDDLQLPGGVVALYDNLISYSSRVRDASQPAVKDLSVRKGNLLLNSSFEVSAAPGWGGGAAFQTGPLKEYISTENPKHGKFCAKILPLYYKTGKLRSVPFRVNDGKKYTLSFWARGEDGFIRIKGS